MRIELRSIEYGAREYELEVLLRSRVLREPLGLRFTAAELALDAGDLHFGAFRDEELVGSLILKAVSERTAKMRQVAVSPEAQGTGVGTQLVDFAENSAKNRGISEIILNARETAVNFYLGRGYALEGEPFSEIGIPHRRMRKLIRSEG